MLAPRTVGLVVVALVAAACAPASRAVSVGGTDAPAPTAPVAATAPASTAPAPSASAPTDAPAATAPPPAALSWQPCGRLQCATLTVPLDYSDPGKGTIDLYVKRRPASGQDRIGSLLVNPGGPGVAATTLVDHAALAFDGVLLNRFDIVSWDPRGTGQSNPAVDCIDNLDQFFGSVDPIPDNEAEKQALIAMAKQFDADCQGRSGRILPYVSTQDTARDMDQLRQALGEDKISYFGFSYGSRLGATYATMFPSHLRATVLDGAIDANAGYAEFTRQQVAGAEQGLQNMLADCAQKETCPFHGGEDPAGAYDALMAKLASHPLPSPAGRPPVGVAVALYGVTQGLYLKTLWPPVMRALAAAERGDGSKLLALYDSYLERKKDGSWSNTWEALLAIDCVDDPGPKDPAFPDTYAAELQAVSPHFGPWMAYNYACIFWPAAPKPRLELTGAGAGPIVVVGTTGDPITPLESTKHVADELEHGVLVTVQANKHTGYQANRCVDAAVDNYLVDLTVPPPALFCS